MRYAASTIKCMLCYPFHVKYPLRPELLVTLWQVILGGGSSSFGKCQLNWHELSISASERAFVLVLTSWYPRGGMPRPVDSLCLYIVCMYCLQRNSITARDLDRWVMFWFVQKSDLFIIYMIISPFFFHNNCWKVIDIMKLNMRRTTIRAPGYKRTNICAQIFIQCCNNA